MMSDDLFPGIRRLRVNSGGEIDPSDVIGREQDLQTLLRRLDAQSILVAAERRIGKTALCKQAHTHLTSATLALYRDIESVNNTGELAAVLLQIAAPHFGLLRKTKQQTGALYKRLAGFQITLPDFLGGGGMTLPPALQAQWKDLIRDTISDLLAVQTDGRHDKAYVCLFLDEFPIALENIRAAEGDRVAMEVLDLFRSLRQTHGATLRFVFTGSIGIHHIVRRLQLHGYTNDPMNDVFAFHVQALRLEDAHTLALGLLLGENIPSPDYEADARCIAQECSCIPFYIHHTVGALRDEGVEANEEATRVVIGNCITSPSDPWKLRHYRARMNHHFPDVRPVAISLLDALAVRPMPCDYPTLCNLVRLKIADADDETIGETLDLLEQDFYVHRDSREQSYCFLRPLLARAWRHIQRLPPPNAHV